MEVRKQISKKLDKSKESPDIEQMVCREIDQQMSQRRSNIAIVPDLEYETPRTH